LNDTADVPKFIETLPLHGYRFIAPVTFSNRASRSRDRSLQAAFEERESRPG
jgi:DNA-binding winged helix-turn-helix (wHTH) protein